MVVSFQTNSQQLRGAGTKEQRRKSSGPRELFPMPSDKAGPNCLKLTKIASTCKYVVTAEISTNAYLGDSKDAPARHYTYKKIGGFEAFTGEMAEDAHKLNAYHWGEIARHVRYFFYRVDSLGKLLNVKEYARGRSDTGGCEGVLMVEHSAGSPNAAHDWGGLFRWARARCLAGRFHFALKFLKFAE